MMHASKPELSRKEALEALLECEGDVSALVARLKRFPWDAEQPLVTLSRGHILAIVQRFLAGDMTAVAVASWADGLEAREDVALEAGHEERIGELIFELANPEINGALTVERATKLTVEGER